MNTATTGISKQIMDYLYTQSGPIPRSMIEGKIKTKNSTSIRDSLRYLREKGVIKIFESKMGVPHYGLPSMECDDDDFMECNDDDFYVQFLATTETAIDLPAETADLPAETEKPVSDDHPVDAAITQILDGLNRLNMAIKSMPPATPAITDLPEKIEVLGIVAKSMWMLNGNTAALLDSIRADLERML